MELATVPDIDNNIVLKTESDPMYQRERLKKALYSPIPKTVVKSKPSRGNYVSNGYIVAMLNTMFGHDGWSNRLVFEPRVNVSADGMVYAQVTMEISLTDGSSRQGTGTRCVVPKGHNERQQAMENAVKGAESDALKRAARLLGEALGNSLRPK